MNWKSFRNHLTIGLTALLVLTNSIPAAAASEDLVQPNIVSAVSPDTVKAKVDPKVTKQFDDDEYVTYLIKMKEQADPMRVSLEAKQKAMTEKVTPAAAKLSMRNAVISSLRETASRTQSSLESYLHNAKAANGGVKDYKSFFIVNALSVTSTKKEMEQLALRPDIDAILPNQEYFLDNIQKTKEPAEPHAGSAAAKAAVPHTANVEWSIDYVNAPQTWNMGIDGTGIVVANLDSGVDYTHPALQRKWRAYNESGQIVHPELSWYDAHSHTALPEDNEAHGTHTMGTMVGSEADGSNQIGVAPGAKWIAVRIFNPSTTDAIILDAGQWLLAPVDSDGNAHPEMAPDVVNNSWGGCTGIDEFFRPIVQAWRAAGIFPEFSAGNVNECNPGGPGSVPPPGNYPESVATGATDINGNIANFSLRGPSPYGELKPEVSAPGVNIRSSVPGGDYEGGWNGTSMSGPITTGIAAMLLQANHSLTVDQMEQILENTATPRTDTRYPESPNQAYGYGIVNALDAVNSVLHGSGTVSGEVKTPGEDTLAPVLEHTPLSLVYSGRDAKISFTASDNIGVTQIEVLARVKGTDDYVNLPVTNISGNYRSGQYEAPLPDNLRDPAGLEYYISVNDYSGNHAETPVYPVEVSSGIKPGYLQDFEGDITGFESGGVNNSWAVGVPKFGPGAAYSGTKAAATNLGKSYPDGVNAYFLAPPIDLTNSPEGAVLSFKSWYNLKQNNDFVKVYIATDENENFVEQMSFTGTGDQWKTQYLDLRPYAGQRIHLLFNMFTSNFGGLDGWYFDDLAVQPPDSLPPVSPTDLTGTSDSGGNVNLTWEASIDEDTAQYEVYRSTDNAAFTPIVMTKLTSFTDTNAVGSSTNYYQVAAVDYSGNTGEPSSAFSIEMPEIVPVFADTFDGSTDNDWTHSGIHDEWERGNPSSQGPGSAVSAPNVWGTRLNGGYTESSDYSLVSPVIDLSQVDQASVYFSNWYSLESGCDFGHFEISPDGGTTWTELAVFNGISSDNQWESFAYDLTPYIHQQVQFRFRMQTDSSVAWEGWYIDNFKVIGTSTPAEIMQSNHVYDGVQLPKPTNAGPAYSLAATDKDDFIPGQPLNVVTPQSLPASATVTVLETGRSVRTDPSTGHFSFNHVAGDFNLKAEAYGYYPQTKPVTIADHGNTNVAFNLEAMPHGRITGVISDERNHQPIAHANIIVMEDANIMPVQTDENGAFSLDVLEGTYTLAVSVGEYYGTQVTVTAPANGSVEANVTLKPFIGIPNGISYDDGTAEDAYASRVSGYTWAVRMTPSAGAAQISGALFKFWDSTWPDPGGTNFKYALYDASGSNGSPGRLIAGPYEAEALRDNNWTRVEFPSPVVVQGDFYIAYIQEGTYPDTPGLGVDKDGQSALRSWRMTEGLWVLAPAGEGNYMINALVTNEVKAPVITLPAANTYTNETSIEVTGLLPVDGSAVTLYNGAAKVGTVSVENGKFTIPVQLQPGRNSLTVEADILGKTTDRSVPTEVTLDVTAPSLTLAAPVDNFKTNLEALTVSGTTSDAFLSELNVNGELANVSSEGTFTHRILLDPGTNIIHVTSKDLGGNETTVTRTVYLDLSSYAISEITPATDVTLNQGDTLPVSFKSTPGLNAAFRIELPSALQNTKANEIAMIESATTPGLYEGSYKTPDTLILDGGVIVVHAWDDAGNVTEAVASGKLFVNIDSLWEIVNQAKDDFQANISNTTNLNEAVLTLPTTPGITYKVTGSSKAEFINNEGVLVKRPSSSTEVELTVTIASAAKPAIKTTLNVKVTLTAPSSGGNNGGSVIIVPPAQSTNYSLANVINKGQTQQLVKPDLKTDGNKVIAAISDSDLQQALKTEPVAVIVTTPATAQQAQLNLTASQVELLSKSNAANSIVFTNETTAAALPVRILAKAPKNAGIQVTLSSAEQQRAAFTNAALGITVLGTPVAFEVNSVQGTAAVPLQLSSKDFVKQSFVLAKDADTKSAGVLYLGGHTVSPAPATFTLNSDGTTTVTVTRSGYAAYAVVTRTIAFNDIDNAMEKTKIEALASKLLLEGTSQATFSPSASVTRAEFAAMLTRALGLQSSTELPFKDVTADKWYADEVGAAYQAGIITGLGKGSFNPNGTITHQDLAVMLERAAGLLALKAEHPAGRADFADADDISDYAKNSIQTVTEIGLMKAKEVNGGFFFSPKKSTTREEAAAAIFNLLQQSGLIN
ncbi:S8 family serine peptidase [Paenibacillus sp. R14(2021)]|uniref:S8 family serine peptidase n=1 Tax=Paenibacillus sp. R14(2021) TaxID=2859228 RepID=UPI001C6119CB|nr:S8 family serine peptidase [Paenibacillus sp. R14(2021)]